MRNQPYRLDRVPNLAGEWCGSFHGEATVGRPPKQGHPRENQTGDYGRIDCDLCQQSGRDRLVQSGHCKHGGSSWGVTISSKMKAIYLVAAVSVLLLTMFRVVTARSGKGPAARARRAEQRSAA